MTATSNQTLRKSFYDAIVLGADAAGMFCAAKIAQNSKRVAVLDHAVTLGEKIRVSGGGRCNFTNRDAKPENFISENPGYCRSALARYTPQDFINPDSEELAMRHQRVPSTGGRRWRAL
jgi:hypothetical protein